MIGKKISNYIIKEFIAEGGMGSVYLGEHEILGWKGAIKVLHKEYAANDEVVSRFTQEAKMLIELKHSAIVEIRDFGIFEGSPFIIMEYIDGLPLDEYITKVSGPINKEDAIKILSRILDAVQFAHDRGVVHRDLKPSNVMVYPETKQVKILDFGIAKRLSNGDFAKTRVGQKLGTLPYMSPEQVRGISGVDSHTDIYSLGVLFHQMVTGQKPYDVDSLTEFDLSMKIVQEPLPRIKSIYPSVSIEFQDIIDRATAKVAAKRFNNCIQFKDALIGNVKASKSVKTEESRKNEKDIEPRMRLVSINDAVEEKSSVYQKLYRFSPLFLLIPFFSYMFDINQYVFFLSSLIVYVYSLIYSLRYGGLFLKVFTFFLLGILQAFIFFTSNDVGLLFSIAAIFLSIYNVLNKEQPISQKWLIWLMIIGSLQFILYGQFHDNVLFVIAFVLEVIATVILFIISTVKTKLQPTKESGLIFMYIYLLTLVGNWPLFDVLFMFGLL